MARRWGWLIVAGAGVLLVYTAPLAVRAQEPVRTPLPTIVVTQPTPAATPGPSPAATLLAQAPGGYTVQPGDTLLTAALEMGVDVEEMGCLLRPDFSPEQPLVIGDTLRPMPQGTVCHRTQPGETLQGVAAQYGIAPAAILGEAWNALPGVAAGGDLGLAAGRYLRVPLAVARAFEPVHVVGQANDDANFLTLMLSLPANTPLQEALTRGGAATGSARGPVPADWPYGSGRFTWPAYGLLTQGYRFDHRALDIAAPLGAPVTAADRGVVIRAGWNNQGYGQFVIIDHKIDYLTLYAHMDTVFVHEGEIVAQGQVIGTVGQTGNATGPHLHFEIRDFGRLINPLELLAQ